MTSFCSLRSHTPLWRRSAGAMALFSVLALPLSFTQLSAQGSSRGGGGGGGGIGATLTPYVGYVFTGNWYDGPVGTSIKNANSPLVGVQGAVPFMRGLSLAGSVAYSSGDLRIGLPVIGGVNVGSAKAWMYDVALELGGLSERSTGIAPILTAGVGGMTNDVKASVLNARSTNVAFTGGVGVDIGFTEGMAIRLQAKDWVGRFDSKEAIGFRAEGNLAHNIALSAGLRFAF